MAELIQFDSGSGDRIANAVRAVEAQYPRARTLAFEAIAAPPKSNPAFRPAFRIATFTGAWAKDAAKTVTLLYQTATPNTHVATNLFVSINNTAGTNVCAIAREGTAWFLIAAECE